MAIGRTLERYLLREVVGAFVAAVGLAVSVLFVLRLVEFVDLAFARGVPARLVGALAGYIIPSYLEIALPMGALLAVVVVFARLGSEGELLAMRASGLELKQLAAPLVAFSAAVALLSLVLGVWARPWANRGIEATTYEMARTRLTASLRAGVFNTWFGGVILFVDELDQATGSMRNVMLAEEREEFGRKTIFASDGHVESNEDARTAYLNLHSGSLLTYHPSGKYQDKTDFDTMELNLDLSEERGLDLMDNGGPSAMSLTRLLEERRAHLERGESAIEETIELHRKLVLPAAALLLPFLGVPLGAVGGRGVKSRGLLFSTIVVLVYYLMLTGAVTVAREQILPTAVAMWMPDLLLALLAAALFRRATSERRFELPSFLGEEGVNILARQLVGLYLRSFVLCLVGAIALLLVIEFFTRIGDFAAHNSQPSLVAAYFALRVPKWLVDVYPAASLLAVLLGVGSLVRSNEIVAMHACGISIGRIRRPLLVTSIVLSAVAMLCNEAVVPPSAARARAIKDIDIKSLDSRGQLDATSLWLQVPDGFLNIDYFDATNNVLQGITLHGVDPRFHLSRLIEIPRATWQDGRWQLEGGTIRDFAADGSFTYAPLGDTKVDLGGTPAEFRKKAPRADEFSIRQLSQRIRTLEAKGLDPAGFETDLQFKFAQPLSGIITVLIGLPLALRGSRRAGTAQHIGTGMGVCFLYWLMQALTVSAGHAGTLPPILAAWSANAIFVLVGGVLALRN